uniref:C-X-C motif chemokine receptor 3.1 duplicate 1 n=2 Tax=Ctenopharyngodon idella TaxID=7959 RepID=A0A346FY22_CTEID|nr:C-X-C motif chemokine receptor 3.1 duplicate 1 [Ctenopharyngodon idella]
MQVELDGLFKDNKTFDYDDYVYKDEVCPSSTVSGSLAIFIPLLYSVGFLWGLLGNGLVLTILWRKRPKLSVMDIFILNLSVTDSLLLLTLPLWAADAVKGWFMGTGLCKLAGAMFKINFYCGIFTLACMSVDCYLSIVRGVRMFSCKKRVVVYCSCLIILIICLLLSIPDWIYLRPIRASRDTAECYYPPNTCRLASRLSHIVCFVLPALVLLFCCSSVLLKLWHNSKCQQKKKGRSTAVIAALVLAFFICWTPYNITFIVDTAQPVDSISSAGADDCEGRQWRASKITAIFGLLHCIVNPVIYLCLSKEFRRRALTMIKFSACETDSNDISLWDSSEGNRNASVQEEQGSLQPMNDINQQ